MKTKIFFLQILVLTIISTAIAQNEAKIKFTSLTYDFGNIKEEDGVKEGKFEFTNEGVEDLKILNIKASCGCTTSDYTKTPVKKGKKGFIKASYNPAGRPGPFHKTLSVTTNDPASPNVTIFIKGYVEPRPKTKDDEYPITQAQLKFITNHKSLRLTTKETKIDTFMVYNPTDKDLEIAFSFVPPHIGSLKMVPEKLKPKAEGFIVFTYDASKKNEYGYVYDRVSFETNKEAKGMMYISANIDEDFSWMTEIDRLNAPKIHVDNEKFVFEAVEMGQIVNHNFVITNNGKDPLIIRKVKASCGCTATTPEKTTLQAGESTNIKTAFNTSGRKGNQYKSINVITNDPERSNITLSVSGMVLEKVDEIKGDASKGEGSIKIYQSN
ncbi:MAG: DUF1573 domain-containing protein [Bacteroidales bacterium]|jgi:hypothetical protein|nr:DUF1573 domain-containing protein [Bacteroidales bacterium]